MAQTFNGSQSVAGKFHQYNPTGERWYWTVRVFMAFFTILGNAPLLFLFMTRRKLRRILSNRFVFSLNLADLCVGLFVTPPELLCTHWVQCSRRTQLAMYEFFVYTSMLCLCLVTWDRYKSVTRPLTYPVVVTIKQYIFSILVCWAVPFVVALLHFIYLTQETKEQATAMKVFTIVETILFLALPCLALPLAYLHIVCIIRKHKECEKRQQSQVDYNYSDAALSDHGDTLRETEFTATNLGVPETRKAFSREKLSLSVGPESDIERSTEGARALPLKPKPRHPNHDRSITVLGIVITGFVASWVLAAFLHIKESFSLTEIGKTTHPEVETTMNISWLVLLSHSALNPFVYGLVKRDIKMELTKCLKCRK